MISRNWIIVELNWKIEIIVRSPSHHIVNNFQNFLIKKRSIRNE